MKKKSLLSTLLIAGLLSAPTAALADTLPPGFHEDVLPITIHADGVYVPTDVEPYITAGRTMVPLRAAGEALDAEVVWDNPSRSITVQHDGDTVVFYADNTTYYINGEARTTDVAPQLVSGRTMLPMRVFAEALDATVTWDNDLRDVKIDTAAADAPAPTIPQGTPADATVLIQKYYVAADSADPVVGSWKYLGQTAAEGTETGTFIGTRNVYHFISKAANGTYNDIWATVSDQPINDIKDVYLWQNTLTPTGTSYTAANSFDSCIYSKGRNIGFSIPETYFYKLDSHGLFTCTGYYVSQYGQSQVVDLNEIYNRF